MVAPSTLTDADLSYAVHLAIDNTTADAEMSATIALRGYDEAAFAEAQALIDEYDTLIKEQIDFYSDQVTTTETLEKGWKTFYKDHYSRHRKIARAIFRGEKGTLRRLGIQRLTSRTFEKLIGKVKQFYDAGLADAELQTRMARRGLTTAVLEAGRDEVARLIGLDGRQENLKGLAQQATRNRDDKRVDVEQWYDEFREVARWAFADRPDWLERIGIFVRS